MSVSPTPAEAVIARRSAERARLLGLARNFADGLDPEIGVVAVVVFGSVARGDFHEESDIDVLVVATRLPGDPRGRLRVLGNWPAPLEPVAWSPEEYRHQRGRRNPIAVEAEAVGVWLRGASTLTEGLRTG